MARDPARPADTAAPAAATQPLAGRPNAGPFPVVGELRRWMVEDVLPLWAGPGLNPATHVPYEGLLPDGTPDREAVTRVRVIARQIYVYAHACVLGWRPGGGAEALRMFDWLVAVAESPDGSPGFVHRVNGDGSVVDARRDTYDHAFLLLAFGWLARATGEPRVLAALARTLAFVDGVLTCADGTLREDPQDSLPRRQNPHMHMFEAYLGLHVALGDVAALARADALLDRIIRHFIACPAGILGEYFDADLRPMPGDAGEITEPGHMAEWVWLLRGHERIKRGPPGALPDAMLSQALRSLDAATGLLIDEADRQGRPRRTSKRLWPQTELAKAFIAQAEIGRDGAALAAVGALDSLRRTYLEPAPRGAWIDQIDGDGRVMSNRLPASSLYHLFVAVAEADRVLGSGQGHGQGSGQAS